MWSRRFGNTDPVTSAEGIASVATTPSGFSYVAGAVMASVDFQRHGVVEGPGGAFIAKVDPQGDVVWVRSLHAASDIDIAAVALDQAENAWVAGAARGEFDAGGGPIAAGGNTDAFAASFDSDGNLRFATIYGSSHSDTVSDIAVHADGSVALAGSFYGTINFGGGQLTATSSGPTEPDQPDLFVAVLDEDGGHLWSRRFGDGGGQRGGGVAFDGDANVVVATRNYGTVDFGGFSHTSAEGTAIALAKLGAATGQRLWSRQFTSTNTNSAGIPRLEADANRVFLGTHSSSLDSKTIDWGAGPSSGIFHLVSFAEDGATLWARAFGSLRGISSLAPDAGGAVIISGSLEGTADFGGVELASFDGSRDAFIAKYGADDGALRWARAVGDVNQQHGSQSGNAVGVDARGFIYFGGAFGGVIDMGDGEMTASGGFSGTDAFFAKLLP